jgi:hypothetical protein
MGMLVKVITKYLFSAIFLLTIISQACLISINYVFAASSPALNKAMTDLNTTAQESYGVDINTIPNADSLSGKIGQIVGIVLSFVGVGFFLLMIYAGFTWMFARGNEADVTKAKGIMTDAIFGLLIVLAAYAITNWVAMALALK